MANLGDGANYAFFNSLTYVTFLDTPPQTQYPEIPMIRDTILAPPGGHIILRFRADNPGVWLFHCHLEWHLLSGLVTTFIEASVGNAKEEYYDTGGS
ncbi:multicopper oxidase-domain-containing protein [Pyronema omphalodes]|nr:multicopper oxidase-domain-containing protein [Pyronema omphalodes]